ncbi:MAG: carboxypeptidase-like regulatory domain-containing protein [Bryobacteraceae bacterium]|jgi:hypothetical protein
MSRIWAAGLAALLLCAPAAIGQKKKSGQDKTRDVQGAVTSPDDKPVAGAVVYLKNLKTLMITSFIAKDDGTYDFHGLSPDIDYELKAASNGLSSPVRTLSSFDSSRRVVINLKLSKE